MEWLQIMWDLEDLGLYEIVQQNIKCRTHLTNDLRALKLYHLVQEN